MVKNKNTKDVTEERLEAVEEALTRTERILEKHQKNILTGIGIVIIIVLGYFSFQKYYLEPVEEEASEQMWMAEKYFGMDSLQLALDGDGNYYGFLDIIEEYGITKSANLANYYAGISYLRLGQYEDAIDFLGKFSSSDQILAPMALGAIGDAYMELGETSKAASFYLDAANKEDNAFTSPLFMQKAAWAYELEEDYKKALQLQNRLKKDFPDSAEGRESEKYIALLKAKLK
ncbi:MAG: tetratricopeptide repeat protein [Bacteroidales bacterium]|jgi:tetratricopeptide (TPR) repeat protein|nr:tetratricopeptide repeat protein [Bacteroidales bacterium]